MHGRLEPPQLGWLATSQLAAWEAIAETWAGQDDYTTVHRCAECGQGIYLLTSVAGVPYRYTREQVLSLTVLHLRNFHPGLDPDRPDKPL